MQCPYCGASGTRVMDSRLGREGNSIRRRRCCSECERRFTTFERVEDAMPLVVKKDGRRQPYDRSKIVAGIQRACEKRPVSVATIEKLVDRLEIAFTATGDPEIPASQVGQSVMESLKEVDQVAYVRFASVYRQFKDPNEFMNELRRMLERSPDACDGE